MRDGGNNSDVMLLCAGVVLCLAVLLAILGFKRQTMDSPFKRDDARLYCTGMILYALDHQQHYPTNLSQTLPYWRKSNLTPGGTNGFEIIFQGSMDDLTNAVTSRIIVLRSESWQAQTGKWARIYGFADGHCETHVETNGDFTDWETQHSLALNRD
jgi:hypothetical protein